MSYREQKKYFEILKRYERKFQGKERERYAMLVSRDKDEEDLDKESLAFLKELHEKYHVNRPKQNYDRFFNKPDDNQ